MGKYKALDIARWLIHRNKVEEDLAGGDRITLLKLLKLLYYAEGCSLALDRGSLFPERIVAWEYGPAVPVIWHEYEHNPCNIPYGSKADYDSIQKIKPEDQDLLEDVFQTFGQYSAWKLCDMTHYEAPWLEATHNGQMLNSTISRKTMKIYFKENYIE